MITEEKVVITREKSLGQQYKLNFIDKLGIYLSSQRVINEVTNLGKPIKCLEVGCGFEARLLSSLVPHIDNAVGIDVCIAEHVKNTKKLKFIEGRVEEALKNLQSEQFNLILVISVLEHLSAPLTVLQKIHSKLSKNGILLINVPTWRGKFFLELIAFKLKLSKNAQIEMNDHKMYYNEKDLWQLLIKAGFKPSQIEMNYYKFGLNLFCKVTNTTIE